MGPRSGLSTVLILGALVLMAAIAVGNNMGNRVLRQVANRTPNVSATAVPTPTASAADDPAAQTLFRRRQVLSVATDPAFPDPRITPEPPVPQTPRPQRKPTPNPSPSPGPTPSPPGPLESHYYTSPPLLIPMTSHAHDQDSTAAPDESAAPSASASNAP